MVYGYEISRGVYQTTQTAKIAPKPSAKWHNRTAPHHTAWCNAVCGFIIRKPYKPHCTVPFYILIYLIIFNIKYIINSLITLVFPKKKKFDNHSNPK